MGPSAMSEPESKVIAKVMEEAPMTVYIDTHSYTELVLTSPAWTRSRSTRHDEYRRIGGSIQAAIRATHGKVFREVLSQRPCTWPRAAPSIMPTTGAAWASAWSCGRRVLVEVVSRPTGTRSCLRQRRPTRASWPPSSTPRIPLHQGQLLPRHRRRQAVDRTAVDPTAMAIASATR